jgi:hypothetical protein
MQKREMKQTERTERLLAEESLLPPSPPPSTALGSTNGFHVSNRVFFTIPLHPPIVFIRDETLVPAVVTLAITAKAISIVQGFRSNC